MNFNFSKAVKAQKVLRKKLELIPLSLEKVKIIAGCDLTFLNPYKVPTLGIGAFVVLKFPEMEVLEKVYVIKEVEVPYVPGFLAFREIPLLLSSFLKLKVKPDLVVVDGHGIAHPRGLGIASHFGVVLGIPTVGCAKKLLYGKTFPLPPEKGAYSPIVDPKTDKPIGFSIRSRSNVKPIFVSPGNKIDLESCLKIALELVNRSRYRIPEPTRLAHNYLVELRKLALHGSI